MDFDLTITKEGMIIVGCPSCSLSPMVSQYPIGDTNDLISDVLDHMKEHGVVIAHDRN